MKKLFALLLAAVMCFSFVACGKEKLSDIKINGSTVSVTDFLIEHLREYTNTEEFAERENQFADIFGEPETPFTVTRVLELKADELGESKMSIHYLLVKADWRYCTDGGDGNDNILIVVNYDTGEVLDPFMADESWLEDTESPDYWNYIMLNCCLVGSGYDGGVIVVDRETRTELSKKDIAEINKAIRTTPEQEAQSAGQADVPKDSNPDTEQTDAPQSEAKPAEQTIEITLDNWQEYLEINRYLSVLHQKNSFGEVTNTHLRLYTLLELKEEYSSYKADVAVEFDMDYCVSDIIYNLDDFSFELVDCVSHPDATVDESLFVRGAAGTMFDSIQIERDKIVDGKVEQDWIAYDSYTADVYRQAKSFAFEMPMHLGSLIEQNEDGTGYIEKCPTNIQITRIEGTLEYSEDIAAQKHEIQSSKQTETPQSNAEPVEKTIEITLDNWQEYFEIRPNTHGALYDSFGEFERLDYVNWAMFLKHDVADNVTKLEDVAIEYSFRDGYFCWFEYNLDTKELVQKNAAAEGEVDSWLKVADSNRDLPIYIRDENGCFLVFINKHLSESLNDNIYSFIGEAYETMEIVRIKGTITISE